ncbi:hypothetical protein RB195_007580 [Necator americanus]|uniref:Uncharacterized protein n=1 Tax=Necator americanus TaxID=51031 RepID=A0ABR1C0R2_NECAM
MHLVKESASSTFFLTCQVEVRLMLSSTILFLEPYHKAENWEVVRVERDVPISSHFRISERRMFLART